MRRKSDKIQARLTIVLIALALSSSILSSIIGYKAIRAIDSFGALMDSMRGMKSRSMLPEGY